MTLHLFVYLNAFCMKDDEAYLSYIVYIIAADDLVMQGARASAAMAST